VRTLVSGCTDAQPYGNLPLTELTRLTRLVTGGTIRETLRSRVQMRARLSPGEKDHPPMTHAELAWEFAELFDELRIEDINEVLAKNVPVETLEFFASYAESFARSESVDGKLAERLPNLLVVGYLLRVLEERLLERDPGDSTPVC
jgi:hypothetical protein